MTRFRLQAITIVVVLLPALGLGLRFATEGPGANPVDDLTHVTGEWGLRFLLLSLAVTPARRFLGWHWAQPLRRTLGLAAFSYALAHLATWSIFDLGLDVPAIIDDVIERPYVTAGMAAFVILLALAFTSTRGWIKRLGARWVTLHRAVYGAGALAVLHHFWLVKADYRPAIVHGVLLAGLLAARLAWRARSRTA
ncbi:MAG: sulfoxide reductase heme-binding subunit YedZ [bacterium]|nr:sulfoxide reductase heme-binding subunit YedZ [bacterium]